MADNPSDDEWKKAQGGRDALKRKSGAIPPEKSGTEILRDAAAQLYRDASASGGLDRVSSPKRDDLRGDIANAIEQSERSTEETTVSEELPETADKAIRGFIALFLLGAVLEGWSAWHHDEIPRALEYWGVGVLLAAVGVWWVRIRTWAGPKFSATAIAMATDFRSWVVAVLLIFAFLAISPFVERREWPFSRWVLSASTPTADEIGAAVAKTLPKQPSADEIAAAVVKALPKPQPPATPDEIAAAVVEVPKPPAPGSSQLPTASNNAALDQMRAERDDLKAKLAEAQRGASPKTAVLSIDDAKYWQTMKTFRDSMPNHSPCNAILEYKMDYQRTVQIWGELQPILYYAGWEFTQNNIRTFFPPGLTIFVGGSGNNAQATTCASHLKELLDGLNITPNAVRHNEETPILQGCQNTCVEISLGKLETP